MSPSPSAPSSASSPNSSARKPATTAMHHEACEPAHAAARIAAITSGSPSSAPASSGLTAAHDLARIGYKVTVFEAYSEPGGMLTVGVPVFRLPRELVRAEIHAILSLGVELKCNMRLGRDFTIAEPARAKATKRSSSASACPRAASCRSRRGSRQASTTAWISCARSTKASRCRWADASW